MGCLIIDWVKSAGDGRYVLSDGLRYRRVGTVSVARLAALANFAARI